MIIALTGRAGVGKTTVAKILCAEHHFARICFAAPLKAMLRALYVEMDLGYEDINRRIAGDLKDAPDPYLCGRTPRHAMQTIGTEWGRGCVDEYLWVLAGERAIGVSGAERIVFDDCRFTNEAEAVRAMGGVVIGLRREGVEPLPGSHASEEGTEPDVWVNAFAGQPDLTALLVWDTARELSRARV